MDGGSRPLTMDENWPSSSAFISRTVTIGVAQGWGERNVQLEPAGSAKQGLKAGFGRHVYRCSGCSLLVFSFSPRYRSMEAAICCGESDLWSEVKKFTAKRRPEMTLPTWTSAAGLCTWMGIGRVGHRRPEQTVELYEPKHLKLRLQQTAATFSY